MRFFIAALLAISIAACGGKSNTPDPQQETARNIASIQQRLSAGKWRLKGYAPEVALEPMLQAWFEGAKASMTIQFLSDHIVVEAPPAIHFDHKYVITQAAPDYFVMTTTSDSGQKYTIHGRLNPEGNKIEFQVETAPMRGMGLLERM